MTRLSANLLLLLVGLTWGLGFVAQATAMEHIGPFLFVALRFCIAAAVVVPFAWFEWRRRGDDAPQFTEALRGGCIMGALFFSGMIFQQVGLLTTSVTNAGMLTGLYVVLVPLIAFAVLREAQPGIVWTCAALAFAGVWLLGGGTLGGFALGDFLMLICALFWAMHVLAVGKIVREVNLPVVLATLQFAVTGLCGLIGFIIVRWIDWSLEPAVSTTAVLSAAPEILYAAIVAGGFAFTLQVIGQRYTRPADAAILLSSEALFAALGGAILLADRLSLTGYLGCAMLFAAIVIVSVNAAKRDEAVAQAA